MIFGNQNNNQDDVTAPSGSPAAGSFLVGGAQPDPAGSDSPIPTDLDDDTSTSQGTLDQPAASDNGTTDDTSEPSQDDSFSSIIAPADMDVPAVVHASVKSSLINPVQDYDSPSPAPRPDDVPTEDLPDDLLELKQHALGDLGPLVNHLDQTPEEKFRTTMMLIQSTDNSALIKDAYAAAQSIADDKIRAQALLDVVNEINYFTQQSGDQPEE